MFTNILVPLDGSELAEKALPMARQLASSSGATIHLIEVVTRRPEFEAARGGGEFSIQSFEIARDLAHQLVESQLTWGKEYLERIRATSWPRASTQPTYRKSRSRSFSVSRTTARAKSSYTKVPAPRPKPRQKRLPTRSRHKHPPPPKRSPERSSARCGGMALLVGNQSHARLCSRLHGAGRVVSSSLLRVAQRFDLGAQGGIRRLTHAWTASRATRSGAPSPQWQPLPDCWHCHEPGRKARARRDRRHLPFYSHHGCPADHLSQDRSRWQVRGSRSGRRVLPDRGPPPRNGPSNRRSS